jgi:hypothetical protein
MAWLDMGLLRAWLAALAPRAVRVLVAWKGVLFGFSVQSGVAFCFYEPSWLPWPLIEQEV